MIQPPPPHRHHLRAPHRILYHRAPLNTARTVRYVVYVPAHTAPLPPAKLEIPSAAALYQRSLSADDLFSYRGRQITTYWRNGHATAVLVSHLAPRWRRIDYLAPDAERGRSVVTDETQEWQFDPRSHELLHRRLAPGAEAVADAAESYDLLKRNYGLDVIPEKRQWADRKVFIITVTRRSGHSLARKVWVDAATGLVLKRESYREDGKLALTIAYSDITFHPNLTRALFDLAPLAARPGVHRVELRQSTENALALTAVRSQLGGKALALPNLGGYRLVSAAVSQVGPRPLLHLRYSDGLNLVSLFEQPRTQRQRPTHVPAAMRPIQIGRRAGHITHHASLTALNWDTDTLNLTLMGELAEEGMLRLAAATDAGLR